MVNPLNPHGGNVATPDQMLVAAFMANVPDHVYFKDRESRFLSVSASLADSLNYRAEEVVGKTDFDFFEEGEALSFRETELRIMATGEAVIDRIVEHTWPDGHQTWSLNVILPMRDAAGQIVGVFGTNKDITKAKLLERDLEKANQELREMSRRAGMAEVATGVLHNVGNVLNSVNVSTNLLLEGLRKLKLDQLGKVCALLREHVGDIGRFMTADPRGRHVVDFLEALEADLSASRGKLLEEVSSLEQGVGHIREIVTIQQSYATMRGLVEDIDSAEVVEDALKMSQGGFLRHGAKVLRKFCVVPKIVGERGKILQILNNLFSNAKYALDQCKGEGHTIEIRIETSSTGMVRIVVKDTGVGILSENLTRIFNQGFTTRKGGHGFGLHSAANAAQSMGGSLIAESAGVNQGATFILELPQARANT